MRRRTSPNPALIKHVPQRTCIACRKVASKRELVRLVRNSENFVEVDTSGKKAGRGAYLCRSRECWQAGLKGGRLEHALRITFAEGDRQHLISRGEELMFGENRAKSE